MSITFTSCENEKNEELTNFEHRKVKITFMN